MTEKDFLTLLLTTIKNTSILVQAIKENKEIYWLSTMRSCECISRNISELIEICSDRAKNETK